MAKKKGEVSQLAHLLGSFAREMVADLKDALLTELVGWLDDNLNGEDFGFVISELIDEMVGCDNIQGLETVIQEVREWYTPDEWANVFGQANYQKIISVLTGLLAKNKNLSAKFRESIVEAVSRAPNEAVDALRAADLDAATYDSIMKDLLKAANDC